MVICFFWSICSPASLQAREMWLMGVYIYVGVYLLIQLIRIVLTYTTDWAEQVCTREETENPYGRPDNCVANEQKFTVIAIIIVTVCWLAWRIVLIVNVRDWRN